MARRLLDSWNIHTRLLCLCLAVAMPLLLMSVLILWQEYRALKNEAYRATTFETEIVVQTIEHWAQAQRDGLRFLASQADLITANQNNGVKKVLHAYSSIERDWQAVIVLDLQGNLIAPAKIGIHPAKLQQLCTQQFFKDALRRQQTEFSGYTICPITGLPAILAVMPVVSGKAVRSFVLASITPKVFLNLLAGLGEQYGSVISIVDGQDKVIVRTLNNHLWQGKDFSQAKTVKAAYTRRQGTLETVGIADPVFRAYAYNRVVGLNWLVISGVPISAIYGPAHNWLVLMVMFAVSAIGLSVYLAYRFTKQFTGPINELVREALAVGRGDLSKRVNLGSGGEFKLLAKAFNQMAENLEINREHKAMVEQISESIRQSLDLDEILNKAVQELGKALSASRCCIALIDTGNYSGLVNDQLVFNYVWWDGSAGGFQLQNKSIVMTDESMLKTIVEQKAILSMDVLDESSLLPLFDSMDTYPEDWKSIKSLMACPIVYEERPLGLILIHQCDALRTWSDSELELVDSIARHVALAMEKAYLYRRTKSLADQQLLINNIVKAVRSSLDLDTTLNTVTKELAEALAADCCQIAQPQLDGQLIVTHEYCLGKTKPATGLNLLGEKIDFNPRNLSNSGLNQADSATAGITVAWSNNAFKEPTIINDVASGNHAADCLSFLKQIGSLSMITMPLLNDERLIGLVMVHQLNNVRQWHDDEVGLVAAIADQVSVAISHAQLFGQVKHQAMTDGLTGLYNHVYLHNRLDKELRRCKRNDKTCSLLMIDLDKLKEINDQFGHQAGDQAIRQVANVLKRHLRTSDIAARYGGEEFAVILPETALNEAATIANRLCLQVNASHVPGLGHISISVGVAIYPNQANESRALVQKADQALYLAKRNGRNQVCIFDGHLAFPPLLGKMHRVELM